MTGCTTCGGFGDRHDPIAHDDWAPDWVTCETCKGQQVTRDEFGLDQTCAACNGDGGREP